MRETRQRSASLEHDEDRKSRLATEENVPTGTKTRKRTEGAAADQAKHGDNCSTNRVDPDPMCMTSFGDDSTGPLSLPCTRDDTLVDNGAVALKPCLTPVEMCTRIAAGSLLPAGTASIQRRGPSFPDRFFLGASEKPRNVPVG